MSARLRSARSVDCKIQARITRCFTRACYTPIRAISARKPGCYAGVSHAVYDRQRILLGGWRSTTLTPVGEGLSLQVSIFYGQPLDTTRGLRQSVVMSPRVRAVLGLLNELNEEERGELRAELDGQLGLTLEQWEQAWTGEMTRRMEQIENGEVMLVDGDEVTDDLRRDLLL